MCGINGILRTDISGTDEARVLRMNAALVHRGPDDGDVHRFDFGVVGMRRLSIVDIDGGHQPFHSSDGRWTIVFNGEVYDYKIKQRNLAARGYKFTSDSDTEVLLATLMLDGVKCLPVLNGMFAFAAVDHFERKVILARDRYGIKPLYYYFSPEGAFHFSSELSALVSNPDVPRRLDYESLKMLLVDRYVADPWTLYAGVHQLPPGCAIEWSENRIRQWRYYCETNSSGVFKGDEADALSGLRDVLQTSISSQLVADVPVGVFLSGGVDSTTVAAFAAKERGSSLKTFTVAFPARLYDESAVARRVARHLGSDHTEVQVEDLPFREDYLVNVVRHVGQPLGDTSCIPTFMVCKEASQSLKAVLSGDGGDEFFGGYDHIRWAAMIARLTSLPLKGNLADVLGWLEHRLGGLSKRLEVQLRRYRRGLAVAGASRQDQLRCVMSLWSSEQADSLLRPKCSARESYSQWYSVRRGEAVEEVIMRQLEHTYLPGAILTKVDRMSMANSLEVRVPLLDNRVTEFARALPLHYKLRGRLGKYLLREAGRQLLPKEIYARPKKGFTFPLKYWLKDDFWEALRDRCSAGSALAGLFDDAKLQETVSEAQQVLQGTRKSDVSEANLAARVWLLAQIGVWIEQFRVAA